jgi:hypothetical protein
LHLPTAGVVRGKVHRGGRGGWCTAGVKRGCSPLTPPGIHSRISSGCAPLLVSCRHLPAHPRSPVLPDSTRVEIHRPPEPPPQVRPCNPRIRALSLHTPTPQHRHVPAAAYRRLPLSAIFLRGGLTLSAASTAAPAASSSPATSLCPYMAAKYRGVFPSCSTRRKGGGGWSVLHALVGLWGSCKQPTSERSALSPTR